MPDTTYVVTILILILCIEYQKKGKILGEKPFRLNRFGKRKRNAMIIWYEQEKVGKSCNYFHFPFLLTDNIEKMRVE